MCVLFWPALLLAHGAISSQPTSVLLRSSLATVLCEDDSTLCTLRLLLLTRCSQVGCYNSNCREGAVGVHDAVVIT